MNVDFLQNIGLTKNQAAAYIELIKNRSASAPKISSVIKESRTNTYKILDALATLGLAKKQRQGARVEYFPANPSALENLIKARSNQVADQERQLKSSMPDLLDFFFKHSEQPGVRFFQGQKGMVEIYKDQLKTRKPIYYIRSPDDVRFLSFDEIHEIRNKFPAAGIKRYAITPDSDMHTHLALEDRIPVDESDRLMLLTRTWVDKNEYTEPVEWSVYGDKVSIISYGDEAIGMVIESPQISGAFKRIFELLCEGIKRGPGYSHRPFNMTYTAKPNSLKTKTNSES